MGTLVQHGKGDGAIWTYTPIGQPAAYEKVDTASLLLLAVAASRLVWRRPPTEVYAAWHAVLAVARGRQPPRTWEEAGGLIDRLLPEPAQECHHSIKLVSSGFAITPEDGATIVRRLVFLACDYYTTRYHDAPLGDRLAHGVIDLLSKIAFLLREEDRGLEQLRDLEVRCLVHHWTHTHGVVPSELLRQLLAAPGLKEARALAQAWKLGPEPPAFSAWPVPVREPAPERSVIEVAQRSDADLVGVHYFLQGLLSRDVQG